MIRVLGGPGDNATHIENRAGEPCANPYLYMASQIASGFDGIDRELDPGPPETSPYESDKLKLPASLMDAVDAVDSSEYFRRRFGDTFVDYILTVKRHEIGRFLAYVTDWEYREYFEIY